MGMKGVRGLRLERRDPNEARGGGEGRGRQQQSPYTPGAPSASTKFVSAEKRKARTDRQAQGELGVPKRLRHQGLPEKSGW